MSHLRLASAFDTIVDPAATPEILADGLSTGEGPVWIAEKEMLSFTDVGLRRSMASGQFSTTESYGLGASAKASA